MAVILFFALVQLYLIAFSGFWAGFFFAFLLNPVGGLLLWVREVIKNILAKARMWEWLRYKFNTWEEVAEWLMLTPGYAIDAALELDDNTWIPKKGGGYEIKVN